MNVKRIRMSGKDRFGSKNMECSQCGFRIIKDGEPLTPIYYEDEEGNHFCSPKCAS